MVICSKCGAECAEDAKVCSVCGAELGNNQGDGANKTAPSDDIENTIHQILDTPDTTECYDKKDIDDNKAFSILAYIGFLVFVPMFAAKGSKFARFHTNQGLILLICEVAASILSSVFWVIPYMGRVLSLLIGLPIYLVTVAFMVIGIVNAAKGKAKELPFIGQVKIIK